MIVACVWIQRWGLHQRYADCCSGHGSKQRICTFTIIKETQRMNNTYQVNNLSHLFTQSTHTHMRTKNGYDDIIDGHDWTRQLDACPMYFRSHIAYVQNRPMPLSLYHVVSDWSSVYPLTITIINHHDIIVTTNLLLIGNRNHLFIGVMLNHPTIIVGYYPLRTTMTHGGARWVECFFQPSSSVDRRPCQPDPHRSGRIGLKLL